ncbi:MAG: DoxX family membrane protein [Deltaproteobacteria bacterium]|nr:DoxX family membrane protein [Deltaproteobacteria bacterium]
MAAILLLEGYQKFMGGWFHGDAVLRITQIWLNEGRAYSFFLPILKSAHAHPKIFGVLITLGELAVGFSMLLGVVTRLGAFLGIFLMGSIAAASGQALAPPGNALLMTAIMVTFLFAPPGRVMGFDQSLRTRLPSWMT